jgi:oligopeptide transport system ATP-binding protein
MVSENLLSINDFSIQFKTLDGSIIYAVNNISLDIKPKETIAIIGESGSGKSQFMLGVMKLLPKNATTTGKVIFNNTDISKLSFNDINKIRGTEISMIFQDPMTSLNPYLKILPQITEVLTKNNKYTKAEAVEKAIEIMEKIGIPEARRRANFYPHQFSGGMKQRIMIAIALVVNPRLVIADEPTTALDVTIQAQILDIFKNLKNIIDASVIFITHDLAVVSEIADKVAVFYGGRIVEFGTRDDVFNNPKHPYTIALLKAVPKLSNTGKEKLYSIEGFPPTLNQKPKDCAFKDRCLYAIGKCHQQVPDFVEISNNHKVACFKAGEI